MIHETSYYSVTLYSVPFSASPSYPFPALCSAFLHLQTQAPEAFIFSRSHLLYSQCQVSTFAQPVLFLPLRPTFFTCASSQLFFMWMILSSNIFVQPFIVFPSHILLQFQSYHLLTPSSLPSLPFVPQLPIQYSCSLRIYFKHLPQPLASIFFSSPIPFNHIFLFPCPTVLGVFPSLSEGPILHSP